MRETEEDRVAWDRYFAAAIAAQATLLAERGTSGNVQLTGYVDDAMELADLMLAKRKERFSTPF